MLAFTMQSFFLGLCGYTAVFVAQYTGAGKPRQAIATVWQALYLSIFAALLMLLLVPVGGIVFRLAGHDPVIQQMERTFFSIFLYGSFAFIACTTVSSYFIGKGLTRVVLVTNLISVSVNILLDYLLIFGHAGFPRLGVAGAALASVIATVVSLLLIFVTRTVR